MATSGSLEELLDRRGLSQAPTPPPTLRRTDCPLVAAAARDALSCVLQGFVINHLAGIPYPLWRPAADADRVRPSQLP